MLFLLTASMHHFCEEEKQSFPIKRKKKLVISLLRQINGKIKSLNFVLVILTKTFRIDRNIKSRVHLKLYRNT